MTRTPTRVVHEADAIGWLGDPAHRADPGTSVITSLPDVSELPELGFEGWRRWFVETSRLVVRWIPDDGVAIFYQSDIRHAGVWIDKGYLVMRAAEEERASIVWHKIVCRRPPGTVSLGRPSYSHMICVSRTAGRHAANPGPDVLADAGAMNWSRAMGVTACKVACKFLQKDTGTRVVVDPFCGKGTALAVANAMGFDAIGVERSAKRCRAARSLSLDEPAERDVDAVSRGVELFDRGAFFEAHEAWEQRWRAERDPTVRLALQGLIQIAAALHKLVVSQDAEAAARLLVKGLAKLEASPGTLLDLDLARFRGRCETLARAMAGGSVPASGFPTFGDAAASPRLTTALL